MCEKRVLQGETPWYSKGLPFRCTGCGRCCSGAPGYVWVTAEEIEEMASYLGIDVTRFHRLYLRKLYVEGKSRFSLVERRNRTNQEEFDCVFLEDRRCILYEVRPLQCRTFPWWPENLLSKASWQRASLGCEGIGHDAPLVEYSLIEKNRTQMVSAYETADS